jgi:PAS domain S-box-containing protein
MKKQQSRGKKLSLEDLMDISVYQTLSESFTRLTGVATAILDVDGKILTGSGWQELCTEFHRVHPETAKRCIKSDTILANQPGRSETYNLYKCQNGLVDVAVPIIIENAHVGNLFTGQFLLESPDLDFFTRQAEEFGFDKEIYMELLEKVPVVSIERIEQLMGFLKNLTVLIGNAGVDKMRLNELNVDLEKRVLEKTAKLSRERSFSDSLINSLPGIMYLFSQKGQFIRWNRNFELITGYSAEQLKNLSYLDLFTFVDDKKLINQAIEKVFRHGSDAVEADLTTKDGRRIPYLFTGFQFVQDEEKYLVGVGIDISERVKAELEKKALIDKLQEMLSRVKKLSGFLPICASCKKIRDDEGYWNQIESYIQKHSEAEFSHSICPDCAKKLYPGIYISPNKL